MNLGHREGASSSFSISFMGQGQTRPSREEARAQAKSLHSRLHASGEKFRLPATASPDLLELLRVHPVVGIFAGRAEWFEVLNFEAWLRSHSPVEVTTAYPRSANDSFEFCVARESELIKSQPFGLFEPLPSAPLAEPSLVFAPCTLADVHGHRMGRGKGHFDRYLARHPGTITVGVCHENFVLEQFPTEWIQPHDRDMCALLTNQRYLKIPNKGDR